MLRSTQIVAKQPSAKKVLDSDRENGNYSSRQRLRVLCLSRFAGIDRKWELSVPCSPGERIGVPPVRNWQSKLPFLLVVFLPVVFRHPPFLRLLRFLQYMETQSAASKRETTAIGIIFRKNRLCFHIYVVSIYFVNLRHRVHRSDIDGLRRGYHRSSSNSGVSGVDAIKTRRSRCR